MPRPGREPGGASAHISPVTRPGKARPRGYPGHCLGVQKSRGLGMESTSTGDRIRVVRKRRGMTQRELAATAGLSYSTVKKIEQGTYGGIRLETLRKLAEAVKVPTTPVVRTAGQHEPEAPDSTMWGPVRQAIAHPHQAASPAPVTGRGLSDALLAAVKLHPGNRYDMLALAPPPRPGPGARAS